MSVGRPYFKIPQPFNYQYQWAGHNSKYRGPSTTNVSGQAILKKLTRKDIFVKQAYMKICLIP
jgi:hypothetical protein